MKIKLSLDYICYVLQPLYLYLHVPYTTIKNSFVHLNSICFLWCFMRAQRMQALQKKYLILYFSSNPRRQGYKRTRRTMLIKFPITRMLIKTAKVIVKSYKDGVHLYMYNKIRTAFSDVTISSMFHL